ncbi:MAG TPA: hypothetical protein DDW19_01740 [Anaerolineaceae bacterium]|nr:hypothetical protein [Anaerolineaceae bacterium]
MTTVIHQAIPFTRSLAHTIFQVETLESGGGVDHGIQIQWILKYRLVIFQTYKDQGWARIV